MKQVLHVWFVLLLFGCLVMGCGSDDSDDNGNQDGDLSETEGTDDDTGESVDGDIDAVEEDLLEDDTTETTENEEETVPGLGFGELCTLTMDGAGLFNAEAGDCAEGLTCLGSAYDLSCTSDEDCAVARSYATCSDEGVCGGVYCSMNCDQYADCEGLTEESCCKDWGEGRWCVKTEACTPVGESGVGEACPYVLSDTQILNEDKSTCKKDLFCVGSWSDLACTTDQECIDHFGADHALCLSGTCAFSRCLSWCDDNNPANCTADGYENGACCVEVDNVPFCFLSEDNNCAIEYDMIIRVQDLYTGQNIEGVTVTILDMDTGQAIQGIEPVVTDEDGVAGFLFGDVELSSMVAVKQEKADSYKTTYTQDLVPGLDFTVYSVSNTFYSQLATGLQHQNGKGILLADIQDMDTQSVGCLQASTESNNGQIYYFDASMNVAVGRQQTDPDAGSFGIVNLDPGEETIIISDGTDDLTGGPVWLYADSVSIVRYYVYDSTAAGCQ